MSVPRRLIATSFLLAAFALSASAGDVRISIPKRTKPTPVQKLNQEGVKEVQKHEYKKAKALFYKAYLIDPNDPFTLNNLGYIAELEGQADRAQRYYDLAQAQGSDAVVYKSTERAAVGKPVNQVAGNAADDKMQVNRINVYAIGLLQKDQAPEADLALQKALKIDPKNPFTLNNLGYAREKEGELEQAYQFYSQAAAQHSDTPIVVTVNKNWRGKGISQVAEANANKVRNLMDHEQSVTAQVARLNTRGVAAINRNDYKLARQYFEKSYKLDPRNAFALNNMGYLAEMDGDRETADYYYDKAKEADQSSMKVAYASRKDVEGMKLASVAGDSDDAVVKATEEAAALRRSQGGPVVLRYRNNQPVMEPATPPKPKPENPVPSASAPPPGDNHLLQPLPDNEQPPAAQPGAAPSGAPSQPPASQPNQGNAPANSGGGLLMPLPDNQQPPAAQQPSQSAPQAQPQNQNNVPRPPQSQSQPQQPVVHRPPQAQQTPAPANSNGGLLMPLPDDQQPAATKQPQQ
ncbi:MAG TPA: tetratricopeptide repeat protein [Terriglobales bacterium]|jgi:tetratricopeptide (TPR) repeat protein|nr:tetratricopeptide repeat protein [Terriglobales bacterium]